MSRRSIFKFIIVILVLLSLIGLFFRFGYDPLMKALGIKSRAGLRVESTKAAKVLINNKEVGTTPYQNEDLTTGEILLELKLNDNSNLSWKRYVKLHEGTLTVVNRDISASPSLASGEVITLEQGKGATIISTPTGAQVSIDGQARGETPISISDIASGEHQFIISKDNYLKRSIRATLVDNYNLTLNVDLAVADGTTDSLDQSTPEASGASSPTPAPSSSVKPTATPKATSSAKKEVVVSETPNGFLRVRKGPSTGTVEVARVDDGETLTVTATEGDWYKIELDDGTEGYVSASYVEDK